VPVSTPAVNSTAPWRDTQIYRGQSHGSLRVCRPADAGTLRRRGRIEQPKRCRDISAPSGSYDEAVSIRRRCNPGPLISPHWRAGLPNCHHLARYRGGAASSPGKLGGREKLRFDGFGVCVTLIAKVLPLLQNIADVIRFSAYAHFNADRRVSRMISPHARKSPWTTNVHRAEPCGFDVPFAWVAIAVVGRRRWD
jgi:hypothetical protein